MLKRAGFIVIAAVNLIGAVLGTLLTIHYYDLRAGKAAFQSFCNIGEKMNCDVVTMSRYAELFPGIPLSSAVVGWCVAIAVIALLSFVGDDWKRSSTRWLFGMSTFAFLYSLFNLFIMVHVLKTYCMLCLGIEAVSISSFAISVFLLDRSGEKSPPEHRKNYALVAAISLFIAIVLLKGADSSEMSRADEDELVQAALTSGVLEVGDLSQSPVLGQKDAPITIVEFSDFQCPFCARGAAILNQVEALYRGKVRVIYKGFPLDPSCNPEVKHSMHQAACEATRAALCAEKQGKFEAVYQALFENQTRLHSEKVDELLHRAEPGVDMALLKTCMQSAEIQAQISKDINDAKRLLVQSTPTFFINGHRIEGAFPTHIWSRIIDSLLNASH